MTQTKILIVEDDDQIRKALSEIVGQAGYEVDTAENGETGLYKALSTHPNMILLDILMPKMDGETMLTKLREDEWGKKAQVIILTNFDTQTTVNESLQRGVMQYLVKADTSGKDLVRTIEQVLGKPD